MFQVPIGNSKCVEIFKFRSYAPMLKYHRKSLNSCCFSSLASAFASIRQTNSVNAISFRIEEFLKNRVGNCTDFDNRFSK